MKINEIFLSIQGEGVWIGLPTIFIRTTGCNLRCRWCDTKYAYWQGKDKSVSQIIKGCRDLGIKRVCLTGGEPLTQKKDCLKLTKLLLKNNFEILIETNGSINISGFSRKIHFSLDIKCPSSTMDKTMIYSNLFLLRPTDQVKFIINDFKDYKFAVDIIKRYHLEKTTNIIFQPVYGCKIIKNLIKNILRDKLNARLGVQLHKVIWGKKRGV